MFSTTTLQKAILDNKKDKVRFLVNTYFDALANQVPASATYFQQYHAMQPEFQFKTPHNEIELMQPLHLAATLSDPAILRELLRTPNVQLNARTRVLSDLWGMGDYSNEFPGETALHIAARRGYIEVCQVLLDAGASPAQQTHFSKLTPLVLALERGHTKVADVLLDAGSPVNAEPGCYSPLHTAVKRKNRPMVIKLLEREANVNAVLKDNDGNTHTVLDYAYDDLELLKLLLDSKKVEAKTRLRLLEKAADQNDKPKTEFLLGHLKMDELINLSLPFFRSDKATWSLLTVVHKTASVYREVHRILKQPGAQTSDLLIRLLQQVMLTWPAMLLRNEEGAQLLNLTMGKFREAELKKYIPGLLTFIDKLACSPADKNNIKWLLEAALITTHKQAFAQTFFPKPEQPVEAPVASEPEVKEEGLKGSAAALEIMGLLKTQEAKSDATPDSYRPSGFNLEA